MSEDVYTTRVVVEVMITIGPILRAINLKNSGGIVENTIFIKADTVDLALSVALEVEFENGIRCNDEGLICLTPGIVR